MRVIKRTFANLSKSTLLLGREGENLVTKLELDISKEKSEFTDPVFELVLKLPCYDEPYPVIIEVVGNKLFYGFTDDDLAKSGFGEVEALVCDQDGKVLKSVTAKAKIDPSIIKNSYPGPLQKVIDHIYEIIEEEIEKHGIPVVNVLPETADVNTVLYLAGTGFYRYTTEWNRITKDDLESTVGTLSAFINKLSEVDGKLYYNGQMIGVDVVDTPNDFSPTAEDGAAGFACFDIPEKHLVYPEQTADEAVQIDYSNEALTIGNPKYSDSAIDALISDFSSWPTATIETEDVGSQLLVNVIPVVPDISDNDYVTAEIEISADGCIVDANSTSKYALSMSLINSAFAFVNPNKIIEVDETHITAPAAAFYAFEDFDGEIDEIEGQLTKGWNIMLVTVELPNYEPTAVSFVNNININDWIVYPNNMSGILEVYGTKATVLLKGIYDDISEAKNKGLYVHKDGAWQHSGDIQDYTPLTFKSYSGLSVRDLARNDSIQDVPVYNVGGVGAICKLLDANDNFVSLEEARQTNGDPVRFIKVYLDGTYYVWLPVPLTGTGSTIPAGWSSGGQTVDAPSLAGFTPVKMEVGETTYEDLSNIPRDVQLALGSLSQCINESADAMGHINVPDDAVIRYSGTIEPNRKYYFSTLQDFSLDLPDIPDDKTDAQFVIYLDVTTNDIDVSFPSGTLVTGELDTTVGSHKIIGCRLRDVKEWAVGGLTYEEASS